MPRSIPNVLPPRLRPYAKAIYPFVAAIATALVNHAFGDPLDVSSLKVAVGGLVLAVLSFGVSNDE